MSHESQVASLIEQFLLASRFTVLGIVFVRKAEEVQASPQLRRHRRASKMQCSLCPRQRVVQDLWQEATAHHLTLSKSQSSSRAQPRALRSNSCRRDCAGGRAGNERSGVRREGPHTRRSDERVWGNSGRLRHQAALERRGRGLGGGSVRVCSRSAALGGSGSCAFRLEPRTPASPVRSAARPQARRRRPPSERPRDAAVVRQEPRAGETGAAISQRPPRPSPAPP